MGTIIKLLPRKFRDKYRHIWHDLKSTVSSNNSLRKVQWYIHRPKLQGKTENVLNLHLGCGEVNHPDFINIDLVPYPHIHYLQPIDNLSNFKDQSVDLIYASHCLEHFSFRKIPSVLAEWNRVLKKGGILRLSVPDFDSIVETYIESDRNLEFVYQAIVGGQDYEYNFHYVVFNRKFLTGFLEMADFTDIKVWTPGSTELSTFDDWSNKTFQVGDKAFPISLNLEAKKAL